MYHAQVSEFCIIMEDLASTVGVPPAFPHPRRRRAQVRWGGKCLMIFIYSGHKTPSSSAASFPWVLLCDPRALAVLPGTLPLELWGAVG